MMQFGISTACFFGTEYVEDAIEIIGRHGCKTIEVFLNTFSEYEEEYIREIRRRIDAYGMKVCSVHPHGVQYEPQLFSPYSRSTRDAEAIYRRVLRAAQLLGASNYILHGGLFFKPALKNTVNFARIGPIVSHMADVAKEYGIRLAYENAVSYTHLEGTGAAGGQELTINMPENPQTLNPLTAQEENLCNVLSLVVEPAIKIEANGEILPSVIENWTFDAQTMTCLLYTSLELAGYEADDILGTLSHQYAGEDMEVYLVTGDRDAFQLVTDHVRVLMTRKGVSDLEVFDEAHMQEVYSLRPSQIVDLKSLMGDSSDNIPGVPGVGEKTAVKLLSQFGTLDSLYSHLDELPKNKLHEKLELNRELAYLSQKLARIDQNIPLSTKLSELAFAGLQDDSLRQALEELEFTSLLKRRSLEREKTAAVEEETLDDIQKLKKKAEEWEEASMIALHYDGEKLSCLLYTSRCV